MEQKNYSLVRAYLGYGRLDTPAQAQAVEDLYDEMWVYYNLFQPVLHLERKVVVNGHAIRNAMIPTVTVLGLTFAGLLAGAVLTETIFSWPGIGRYSVQAALKLDYPALLGVTLFVATAYIFVNFCVDLLYGILDPRIRLS